MTGGEKASPALFDRPALHLLLAAMVVFIVVWGVWSAPILSHNEARRMVVAQEIVRNDNWLLPTMNGELYITKPPLYTWLQAALAKLLGSTAPGVLRLPSVLAALGLFLVLFRFVRRQADERSAWFAVVVLGTSQLFIMHARNAEIEMLLAFFNVTALLAAWHFLSGGRRAWLYLAWGLLALAVLTKGPVALIFFIAPVLAYAGLVERRALACLADPLAWGLFLLLALPWYLYVWQVVDPALIEAVLNKDIVGKVRRAHDPLYSYLLVIAGGFLPWMVVLLWPPLEAQWRRLRTPGPEAWLAWGVLAPLVMMSLFGAKHGKYILPLFPLLAGWIGMRLGSWLDGAGRRAQSWVVGVTVLLLLGTALFHIGLAPKVWSHRHRALLPIVEVVRERGLPLAAYERRPIQLIYHYGRPIPVLDRAALEARRRRGDVFLLLADDRFWPELDALGLPVVGHWPVYLKKKRAARLYRVGPEVSSN